MASRLCRETKCIPRASHFRRTTLVERDAAPELNNLVPRDGDLAARWGCMRSSWDYMYCSVSNATREAAGLPYPSRGCIPGYPPGCTKKVKRDAAPEPVPLPQPEQDATQLHSYLVVLGPDLSTRSCLRGGKDFLYCSISNATREALGIAYPKNGCIPEVLRSVAAKSNAAGKRIC